MVMKPKN